MKPFLLALVLLAMPAYALDDAAAGRAIELARQRLAATAAQLSSASAPEHTAGNSWVTVPNTDQVGWTQGFFPGASWAIADLTGNAAAAANADRWTRALEGQQTNTQTHDLGFKLYLSFGHAYQRTGDPYYRSVLLTAARSLASRYNPTIGAIICCDWNYPTWHQPVVVDTMMNLELLLWGAQNGGDPGWKAMALSHARKTLADVVRSDGSTYHVVDYSSTGAILTRGTNQGFSDASTWTRGQAWAIYGYTMVYRYTRDAQMLDAAQRTADFHLGRLGSDPIPNWDFDSGAPRQKDSSAAAAVASALYELSGYVGPAAQARYQQAATAMLDALASPAYLSASGPSILLHGVGNYPAGHQVDVGLIYGDYYFIEALARRPKDAVVVVPDAGIIGPDAGPGTIDAGPSNTDAGPGNIDAGNLIDAGPGDAGPGDAGGIASDAGQVDNGGGAGAGQARSGSGCASGGDAAALSALAVAAHFAWRKKRAWLAALRASRKPD